LTDRDDLADQGSGRALILFYVFVYILFIGLEVFQAGELFELIVFAGRLYSFQYYFPSTDEHALSLSEYPAQVIGVVEGLPLFYFVDCYDEILHGTKVLNTSGSRG